jgi:hypothetical protein
MTSCASRSARKPSGPGLVVSQHDPDHDSIRWESTPERGIRGRSRGSVEPATERGDAFAHADQAAAGAGGAIAARAGVVVDLHNEQTDAEPFTSTRQESRATTPNHPS